MASKHYELVFVGGISKRYRRWHATYETALETAQKVLAELSDRAAHPAIIYGRGINRDGRTIA